MRLGRGELMVFVRERDVLEVVDRFGLDRDGTFALVGERDVAEFAFSFVSLEAICTRSESRNPQHGNRFTHGIRITSKNLKN